MSETIEDLLRGHRDAISVKRVFGEPFERNGVTVIPAAKVMGGGGGGSGQSPDGTSEGSGSGFGIAAKPAGVYVIRGDDVSWQPALDVNRAIAGALTVIALGLLFRRRRPE